MKKLNSTMKKTRSIFLLLCLSIPFISLGQFEIKPLVKERNFIVNYFTTDEYVAFIIESKYIPFIYTDVNRNNLMDPYIDKMYTVKNGNSLCLSIRLEEGATTTCGQATNAILLASGNAYQFIIPKKELTYFTLKPIDVTFGAYDSEKKIYIQSISKKGAYTVY